MRKPTRVEIGDMRENNGASMAQSQLPTEPYWHSHSLAADPFAIRLLLLLRINPLDRAVIKNDCFNDVDGVNRN